MEFERRRLVPNESALRIEATPHDVMAKEITIVATATIRAGNVVHSPDKTEGANEETIPTTTVITTGIVQSATIQISHDEPYAIYVKNPARVELGAVSAMVEETISNAEIEIAVVVVKPSTITIGHALNVRILISHSVNNATVVKHPAREAVVDDQIQVLRVAAIVTEMVAEAEAAAEAIVTETVAEAVTEDRLIEAAVTAEAETAVVIIARPKESARATLITAHLVIYSRANLNVKTRTEGVELLEC